MGLGPAPSTLVGFSEVSRPPLLSTFLRSASFLGSAVAESGSLMSAWGALKPVLPVVDGWSAVGPLAPVCAVVSVEVVEGSPPVESLLPIWVVSEDVVAGSPDEVLSLPVFLLLGAVEVVVLFVPDSAQKRSAQLRSSSGRRVRRVNGKDQQSGSIPMLPASKGSPAEVSPSLPETGSVPFVSLFMVSASVLTFSLLVVVVLLLLLSPQMALAAVLAIEFIVSMVGQLVGLLGGQRCCGRVM